MSAAFDAERMRTPASEQRDDFGDRHRDTTGPALPYIEELHRRIGNRATQRLVTSEPDLLRRLRASQGEPLHRVDREFYGHRLGVDLTHARVHSGPDAAVAAARLNAVAFSVGSDVSFGAGQYAPQSPAGSQLLAHELAHVAQRGKNRSQPPRLISDRGDPAESEAREASVRPVSVRAAPSAVIQLEDRPPAAPRTAPKTSGGMRPGSVHDPRNDPLYIDSQPQRQVQTMLVMADRYTIFWPTGQITIFNPDIDFSGKAQVLPVIDVMPSRDEALKDAAVWKDVADRTGYDRVCGFYKGPGGVIFPTVFAPSTAPGTYATIMKVHDQVIVEARAAANLFRDIRNGMIVSAIVGGALRVFVPGSGIRAPITEGEGTAPVGEGATVEGEGGAPGVGTKTPPAGKSPSAAEPGVKAPTAEPQVKAPTAEPQGKAPTAEPQTKAPTKVSEAGAVREVMSAKRVSMGKVPPPKVPTKTTTFGDKMHDLLDAVIRKRWPGLKFRRAPLGEEGPDMRVTGRDPGTPDPGFDWIEIKPNTPSGISKFVGGQWGKSAVWSGRGRLVVYDVNGDVWLLDYEFSTQ